MNETDDIDTKIDRAAQLAKRLAAKVEERRQTIGDQTENAITDAQTTVAQATKRGGHRFSEAVARAAHRFQETATKLAHLADEWADRVASRADAAAARAEQESRKLARKLSGKS